MSGAIGFLWLELPAADANRSGRSVVLDSFMITMNQTSRADCQSNYDKNLIRPRETLGELTSCHHFATVHTAKNVLLVLPRHKAFE